MNHSRFVSPRQRHAVMLFGACAWAIIAHGTVRGIEVEAYSGRPFGVGRVTFSISGDGPAAPLEDERFTAASPDGRVLYPVLMEQPVRRLLRRLLEIESPRTATMYFLFRGDEPFELDAYTPSPAKLTVTPRHNPVGHKAALEQWWREYGNQWSKLRQDAPFPPVVENFLAANLSRRLGLPLPEPTSGLLQMFSRDSHVWDDLFVTESHQLAIDQQLLSRTAASGQPSQPLPPPMPWYDLQLGEDLSDVAVEPISLHVPAEAFYLRFGSFSNYHWFRRLSKKWQGDLGNMISRRAIERAGAKRIEQQLSLQESVLAQFLGPQVIEDVAIIGLDPYLDNGGAIGVLFQAKNSSLLAQDLNRQRRTSLTAYPDAVESTVRLADRDASLIATPDGKVRSFYLADGDFHLVTTSRRLMQRFIQAGQGDRPLAASAGFLGIRKQLTVERTDAVFAYAPPEFFRELTSPAIWIESQRRARSAREMKLVVLAPREAAAERIAATEVADLIAAGLLPDGFGARADGSELVVAGDDCTDSLRGNPGAFLAVSEVEVTAVTPEEAAAYREFSSRFRQEIGQTPPVAAAISRVPLQDGGGESLSVDILATPLDDVRLGRLPDSLGEPSLERTAPVEGDLVHGEFVLDSPIPLGAAEPHHLIVGVRDFRSPLVVNQGRLAPGAPPAELVRMYLATWPKPGGLVKFFLGDQLAQGPEPIAGRQDTWQAKQGDFLLISFKSDVVQQVLPQLQIVPAAEPAQAWIDVADLTGTELSGTVNALGYMRARETSVAACRLMNTLSNQLHVPPDECRAVAEQLMDGVFDCPLGGEYELAEVPNGRPMWTSSALAPQNRFLLTEPPDDFQLPVLSWFRGLRGEALFQPEAITAHVEIDMDKSAVP